MQGLDNVHWIPGLKDPADGLTKTKGDLAPLSSLVESGGYNPGILRPLKGIAINENVSFFLGFFFFAYSGYHEST